MPTLIQTTISLVRATLADALEDDVFSLSAAIAYYTVFSLPALLVVLIGLAGAVLGPDRVAEALLGEARSLVGPEGSAALRAMIENTGDLGQGIGAKVAGVAVLVFGAAGAFGQLQKALNRAWEVEETRTGVLGFVVKRLLSFGMVVTITFFLLVSLAVSAALSAVGAAAADVLPGGLSGGLLQVLNLGISLLVVAALFAILFKVLPDADIDWRDAAVGGLVTAILFTVGKTGIGIYLGQANPGSAFGAAGSLALILVWIYYSALIVLLGAEFTQQWAKHRGRRIQGDAPENEARHPLAEPRDPAPY